ncbi:MAG TPA: ABC transporter substrate-binding protein [Rhodocyclaceae bacterium]|nr:ABC transporter substrate-binding protein [Rhodocyclaceae bacterium]
MRTLLARLAAGLIVLSWLAVQPLAADDRPTVRVGVLQYGTVSWELEVIRRAALAEREGVDMVVVPLALNDAANVALQGGAVDVIVNDWIWVSRQRSDGRDFVFVPYSRAVGGVMLRPDAGVATLAGLRGKRLGIAGGPVDKSWLLLRAYARRTVGEDAARLVRTEFAAPPLLNELMLRGELPAVLNFWHFNARLRAAGMRELISLDEMLAELGVRGPLPMIGWVFSAGWAESNRAAIDGFLRASAAAKALMRDSDEIWQQLRPMMRVDDEATFVALRDGFRAGIPGPSERAEAVARQVFGILAEEGGRALVGNARTLAPGTFWNGGDRQ